MRDTGEDRAGRGPEPEGEGAPKFGRLLIVLAFAILLVVAITMGSEAYFS